MEETLAILMADLSGYTALTETHGAKSAADLIDKYIGIAEYSLGDDCFLHERTGDQVMIVSNSPDSLLKTAIKIATITSREENFLQVHGGLHYGNVLKRNGSYFGSAINMAARIAAKAEAGSIWCSREFALAVEDSEEVAVKAKGSFQFKNITGKKEIFEITIANKTQAYIDPVCNMVLLNLQNAFQHKTEHSKYFCSLLCREQYDSRRQVTVS
ncbi:MAG: adenylate/guanylate cyclase domain-containing protein [Bacteroidota bacterium]